MSESELKLRLEALEKRVDDVYSLIRRYGTIIVLSACFGNRAIDLITSLSAYFGK